MVLITRATLRNAKSTLGRAWGQSRQFMHDVSRTLDVGVQTYNKLRPVMDLVANAYGNQRVQDFNRKAQEEVTAHTQRGQAFMRETTSHMDQIESIGNQFMNACR